MPKKKYKDITAEELVQVLKFTPRTYSLQLYAYGGETYAGTVDRKIYDFFKKHKIDIEEYANGWSDEDRWNFVPDDMRPFEPGSPYDCDDLFHCSGATMDYSNHIEVLDEDNNTIWSCTLDKKSLIKAGVTVDIGHESFFDDQPDDAIIYWGGSGEKGSLFGGQFEVRQPFDPRKLTITYDDCDGWQLAHSVSYDGEDLDNNDYSTTGKWSEHKWILPSGEEVYEGVSRDEVEETEEESAEYPEVEEEWDPAVELDRIWENAKTPWFPADVKPIRKGQYEVEFLSTTWPWAIMRMCEWTGRTWKDGDKKATGIKQWRGLNFDPTTVDFNKT